MILTRDREISVIGESSSGDGAVDMAEKRRPDVIVMDVRMEGMDGFEATRQITAAHPEMAVILYTAHGERGLLAEGLDCGARGYVLKEAPPDDIVRAVKRVAEGGAYVDPTLASELVTPKATERLPALSGREREILGAARERVLEPRHRPAALHQPRDGADARPQRHDEARGRHSNPGRRAGAAV